MATFGDLLAGVVPVVLPDEYLNAIKKSEFAGDPNSPSFTRPYWDVRQWSSGYGTRAAGPNENVDRATLEQRFNDELAKAERAVDQFAPGLDEGTRAALTSLTHNAGTGWMQAGLGRAVRSGNMDEARRLFMQYTSSDPTVRRGLELRRGREVTWIPQGAYGMATGNEEDVGVPQAATPATAPTTPAAASTGPAAPDVRNQPQPAATWSSWLQEPQNRAFLISAGVQMMMPSWGGPMAQIASGIGAGAEAQAATAQQEQDRNLAYAQLASREREGALTRQTSKEVAEIGAGSRLEIANVRSRAMLERARMIGLRTAGQQNEFTRLVGRLYNTEISSLIAPTAAERDAAFQRALDQAESAMRQTGRLPSGGTLPNGVPAPLGGPPATPTTPTTPSTTPSTAPTRPTTPAPSSGAGAAATGGIGGALLRQFGGVSATPPVAAPTVPTVRGQQGGMTVEQFIANPNARAVLADPRARQRLIELRGPEFVTQAEAALNGGAQ